MRRNSFQALWPLFAKATAPAKEMTESFSALEHLRPFMAPFEQYRVIHVGDGAHARTAALFALKTQAENISVDPVINEPLVRSWRDKYEISRFSWRKARIEEVIDELNDLPKTPVFVTFVHAHVSVDSVLDKLRWNAAFSLACCVPGRQLTHSRTPVKAGFDSEVLSQERQFEVLVNDSDL